MRNILKLQYLIINLKTQIYKINTFKYQVSCTDGKISFRIIYFYYLFFHRRPTHKLCFLSCRSFVVNVTFSTGLVVYSVPWLVHLLNNNNNNSSWIMDFFVNVVLSLRVLSEMNLFGYFSHKGRELREGKFTDRRTIW